MHHMWPQNAVLVLSCSGGLNHDASVYNLQVKLFETNHLKSLMSETNTYVCIVL